MMRYVIYSNEDLEPITVIELDHYCEQVLLERGRVRLAVMRPLEFVTAKSMSEIAPLDDMIVELTAERIVRRVDGREQQTLMLFASNDATAMLLKSVFLPGQHRAVQEREREAFAGGLIEAIRRLGA